MADDALKAAVLDVERFVGKSGWDQPARLFALVSSEDFRQAEPELAEQLSGAPGSFTCIEQDGFHGGEDLDVVLGQIGWPETVAGVAIGLERMVVAGDAEADSEGQDVRLVVGVIRSGDTFGVARLRDYSEDLVAADNLLPGLSEALLNTLS